MRLSPLLYARARLLVFLLEGKLFFFLFFYVRVACFYSEDIAVESISLFFWDGVGSRAVFPPDAIFAGIVYDNSSGAGIIIIFSRKRII